MDGLLLMLAAAAVSVAAIRSRREVAVLLAVLCYAAVLVYLVKAEMEVLPVALVLAVAIAGYGLVCLLPTALSDWNHRHPGRHA